MFRREVLVDSVEMTDWHMVLEQWAGGKHSFPKFNMGGGGGPRRFVTTMQYVRTRNGTVTFDDHGSRWGTVARNLDITVTKFAGYRGEATFHGGTVWIQDYVPMSMSMKAVFRVDGRHRPLRADDAASPTAPSRTSPATPTSRTGRR